MMKLSHGNPQMAALAKRVAQRDASTGGNWSAPAKLQEDHRMAMLSKPAFKQTATMSSGVSSALSSFGLVSSATSSSGGGVDDEDWRHDDRRERDTKEGELEDTVRGRDRVNRHGHVSAEETSRARKAALAAAAITGNMEPMGAFGRGPNIPRHGPLHGRSLAPPLSSIPPAAYSSGQSVPIGARPPAPSSHSPVQVRSGLSNALGPVIDEEPKHPSSIQSSFTATSSKAVPPIAISPTHSTQTSTLDSASTRPSVSSVESSFTITDSVKDHPQGPSPNKPKLKGQIQSLAKMLSGLKTKGKD